jgi:hypothetical protein
MKPIQKMSEAQALIKFRAELSGVGGLSSSDRIKLMEEFKHYFSQSMDYDLALNRVMEQLMPSISRSRSQNQFPDLWKSMGAPLPFEKFFGIFQNEESKARRMIDEEFKLGKREVDVLNGLLLAGQQFFQRPLKQDEIDKLRFLVISEKVRLYNQGVKITE